MTISNKDYNQYKYMIYKIANKFKNNIYRLELDDLVQIGAIGLIRGFDTYDETKDCKKDTWLYSSIERAILREFHNLNRIKRQASINSVSIDMPIGEDEDITIADTIEDISVNTSSEALDNVIIEEYKYEVDIILSGMEHDIAYKVLFTDETLAEVSASKNISYSKAKNIQNKAFRELRFKSKLIRSKYLELKEQETENDIINLYNDPAKAIYLREVSKDLKEKYRYELSIIDDIQTILDGLPIYTKNKIVASFVLTLEDILDDKDLIIYEALSEGQREVLDKEYSFSEILFIEDRIKSKIIKNKEYVCELWNEYKNNKSKNKEKFLDNNLYVNQNVYNNQVSLFV
ncbi:sigma factor [Romboutsia sp. MSSM.1001216sp_RTP31141st1_G3_RTP31141_220114]|uniref:sigma factor n=1 Tax=unclassified Romboutsia TaxID=2626894 RepID=UPI0031B60DBC